MKRDHADQIDLALHAINRHYGAGYLKGLGLKPPEDLPQPLNISGTYAAVDQFRRGQLDARSSGAIDAPRA